MVTRRNVLRALGGGALAGIGLGAYGGVVEPGLRLRVQRWPVAPAGWSEGPPLRIAALADPHVGPPWMSLARLGAIVEAANALAPDLVVLLGDYAASHRFVSAAVPVSETARVLAGLRARLGRYAVMGNHDWWDDPAAQARGNGPIIAHRAFEAAGIPVLENRAIRLAAPGGAFWLAGLGDQLALTPTGGWRTHWQGVDDLPGTLAQITDGAPAILLAHEPDIFPRVPDRVALTLAGHTHGGQVRLFGHSPVVPSRHGNRYAYGHVVEDGRHLVVSGGLGCSIAPVRLGVPPEITLIEIG